MKTFTHAQRYQVLALMSLASESKDRGIILDDDEDLAATLDISEEDFAALVERMERKGITERCQSGRICFINFLTRQYDNPSDRPEKVAERKARLKERQQNAPETGTETPAQIKNAPGTTKDRQKNDIYSDTEDTQKIQDAPQQAKKPVGPPGGRNRKPAPIYLCPPSLQEVKEFCELEGWGDLGQAALDFQTQRGWQMKSGPVTDWKAAVRTWKYNDDKFHPPPRSGPPRSSPPDLPPEDRAARNKKWLTGDPA